MKVKRVLALMVAGVLMMGNCLPVGATGIGAGALAGVVGGVVGEVGEVDVEVDGSPEAEETFTEYLGTALGRTPSETDKQLYSSLITTCVSNGYSGAAIMGICGNIAHESSGNIFALEGHYASYALDKATGEYVMYKDFELGHSYEFDYSRGDVKMSKNSKGQYMYGCGHGIIQWSFGRAHNLDLFAQTDAIAYITVKHKRKEYSMPIYEWETCHTPDAASQVIFLLTRDTGFSATQREKLKAMTDPREAATYFCQEVEKPAGKDNPDVLKARSDSAVAFYDTVSSCPGVVGSVVLPDGQSIGSGEVVGAATSQIEDSEYWTEEQKHKFAQLVGEMELVGMVGEWSAKDYQKTIYLENRGSLSVGNTVTLVTIGQNILSGKWTASKIIDLIMSLGGYLVMLYGIFIVIAYLFDRTNQFLDVSLLGIFSFGKWRIAEEEDVGVKHGKVYLTAKGLAVRVVVIEVVGVVLASKVILAIMGIVMEWL